MTTDLPTLRDLRAYTKGVYVRKAEVIELIKEHAAAHHERAIAIKTFDSIRVLTKERMQAEAARDAVLKLLPKEERGKGG